jgi:hypothetical protein
MRVIRSPGCAPVSQASSTDPFPRSVDGGALVAGVAEARRRKVDAHEMARKVIARRDLISAAATFRRL